jgi:hypothetical protein
VTTLKCDTCGGEVPYTPGAVDALHDVLTCRGGRLRVSGAIPAPRPPVALRACPACAASGAERCDHVRQPPETCPACGAELGDANARVCVEACTACAPRSMLVEEIRALNASLKRAGVVGDGEQRVFITDAGRLALEETKP